MSVLFFLAREERIEREQRENRERERERIERARERERTETYYKKLPHLSVAALGRGHFAEM